MSARIENGAIQLLTRAGLDWTAKYPATAAAIAKVKVKSAYRDGELCGVRPDGVTSFEIMQHASERGEAGWSISPSTSSISKAKIFGPSS
jgi:ATP-dependent DNA ligase